MDEPLNILSLGAGVQSTTVLLMSCLGELPKLDAAIFADTGWEPEEVYLHLDWLMDFSRRHGIDVHCVSSGNIRDDGIAAQAIGERSRFASMPFFILKPDGTTGMVRRQCTDEYKIKPVTEMIRRDFLKLAPGQRAPAESCRLWFGISRDEWQRMRTSNDKWRVNYYPLFDRHVTRYGCEEWLRVHGFPVAPRSACIGCPYHNDAHWRLMKDKRPDEWADACDFDDAVRNDAAYGGKVFLHRSCVPLRDVDLRTDFDKGQLPLFQPECDGFHCMSE